MGNDERRWTVASPSPLRWRSWDDEFLVFNTASGETHHLNLIAATVLQRLEQDPATVADLMGEIRSASVDMPGLEQLPALLETLDELGLITPIDP